MSKKRFDIKMRVGVLLLVILGIMLLSGCVRTNISYRDTCVNCDSDLKKWKEDCLPTCLDREKNPNKYNMSIPAEWELAGIQKEKFSLTPVGGQTKDSINCVCVFQKLTPEQHDYISKLIST